MKFDRYEIRKVIRVNNLLWKATFYDELVTLPCYDLCFVLNTDVHFMNCAMNFELENIEQFDKELENIEQFFKIRRKPSSVYLTDFDEPKGLDTHIVSKGYSEIAGEEGVFWGLSYNEMVNSDIFVPDLEIKECRTKDDLAEYLIAAKTGYNDFDYTPYAASMSKLFNTSVDGITQLHFVGYVNKVPVACGTIGILFTSAIWINAAVIPEYRKKGINTAMMVRAIQEAHKLGANNFYFSTDADNIGSIRSGTHIGFTEVVRQRMFSK